MITYTVRSKISDYRLGSFQADGEFFAEASSIVHFSLWCEKNGYNLAMCYFQAEI